MIKRLFCTLAVVAVVLFASCEKYDRAIDNMKDRLDKIEGTSLTTIDQQITAINGSIDDLKVVDAELKGYIDALQNTASDLQSKIDATNAALATLESDLEGQITASEQKVLGELNTVKTALEGQLAAINSTIATLQAKDAELDQKIADLQKYVDNEITATENWATATFSTLEQYEATQTAISEINALIKSTQESITALEEKLSKKIADDIAAAVAGVNADMAAKVTEITDAYTAAIATAKKDITTAYTDAIKTAITASETSMKEWVNGVLADGYYTKAELDGKITALQTQVTEGDAALQKEIDALAAALAQTESDLTAAYKKAIADAIYENNGQISAEIAAAVKTAQDNLQAQIDAINSEIEKIKARLDVIEADINSINQQITAINGSIDDLKVVDAELKGYIESLQTSAADLQSQIDATNTEIEHVKKEMGDEIDAVEQSLLNKLDNLKAALEGELAAIKANIETLKAKDTELEGRIATLETYVDTQLQGTKDWANATFATLAQYEEVLDVIAGIKGDIAAINTAMANLETNIDKKISTDIKAAIDALRTELGADYAAKIEAATDAVTSAYTAAIATAKGDIEAAYTKAIADAIAKSEAAMKEWVNAELQKVYADISALRIELEALRASAATDEELAAAVTAQQAALEQAKKALTAAYVAAIKKAIEDNNGVIDDAIATAITAATTNLQNEIAGIKSEITSIKSRLDALEKNFANRIQSLSYVPEYIDGKATMNFATRTTTLDFILSPASLTTTLKTAFDADNSTIKAFVRYVKTRASDNAPIEQLVKSMTVGSDGLFTLQIGEQGLSDEFWLGNTGAVIYIQIIDRNSNNVVSDMIPLVGEGATVQQLTVPVPKDESTYGQYLATWEAVPNADFYYVSLGAANANKPLTEDCWSKQMAAGAPSVSYSLLYNTDEVTPGDKIAINIVAASNSALFTSSDVATIELTAPKSSTLTITYQGSLGPNFGPGAFGEGVEFEHDEENRTITIKSSSAVIAAQAFQGHSSLEGITLPEGVTAIEDYAFSGTSLMSITLPKSVTSIGNCAFRGCSSLATVVMKGDVTSIGNYAFQACASLETVKYYGTTEPTSRSNVFYGSFIELLVTAAYPGDTFCGISVDKTL